MSSGLSCKQCGCSEIDTDPARGDAVCTQCGFVLEESIIVSEVTFEEDGHGGASAIGQFVSSESRGGGGISGAGAPGFHSGIGKESRELTLRNAKKRISEVAQQLRLNQHCIEVAHNFYKMALHKQLTKGRKHSLTVAACIYMTCRIEGTPHLLIDFSDVLQMDVYALGRAYCHIARSLYINIPAVDPCMYILRFAHKFELGDKTHDVSMTALRLVQRMKRDWIHLGRRPSGLCGAALLISARLHSFSRSVQDVIRVVKVHETTLRKRLVEFGETPSSSLTLDEFMSVDLEEEHDPPSFKAARIKDRERLQKLLDADNCDEFKDIQAKIEEELNRRKTRVMNKSRCSSPTPSVDSISSMDSIESGLSSVSPVKEMHDEKRFIVESTISTINNLITEANPNPIQPKQLDLEDAQSDIDKILMPPPTTNTTVCVNDLEIESEDEDSLSVSECGESGELDLDGIDDNEIDGYLMNNFEVKRKTVLWEKLNADYILEQKVKQEQLEQDIKEGKVDKKKKRKAPKPKATFQAKSANEAIKIMLKERKVSNKINYEVLRSLTAAVDLPEDEILTTNESIEPVTVIESGPVIPPGNKRKYEELQENPLPISNKKSRSRNRNRSESKDNENSDTSKTNADAIEHADVTDESEKITEEVVVESGPVIESGPVQRTDPNESEIAPYADEDEDMEEDEDEEEADSARRLLTQFRGGDEDNDYDDYY